MRNRRLVIYMDVFGGWRWEHHGSDGEVRDSTCSFDTRRDCAAHANQLGLTGRRATLIKRERNTAAFKKSNAQHPRYRPAAVADGVSISLQS